MFTKEENSLGYSLRKLMKSKMIDMLL